MAPETLEETVTAPPLISPMLFENVELETSMEALGPTTHNPLPQNAARLLEKVEPETTRLPPETFTPVALL